jgi:hypothetical protein
MLVLVKWMMRVNTIFNLERSTPPAILPFLTEVVQKPDHHSASSIKRVVAQITVFKIYVLIRFRISPSCGGELPGHLPRDNLVTMFWWVVFCSKQIPAWQPYV